MDDKSKEVKRKMAAAYLPLLLAHQKQTLLMKQLLVDMLSETTSAQDVCDRFYDMTNMLHVAGKITPDLARFVDFLWHWTGGSMDHDHNSWTAIQRTRAFKRQRLAKEAEANAVRTDNG